MTTRNLEALFRPASIALIGATNHRGSIGAVLTANLLAGPFKGPIWLVSAQHRRIRRTKVYRDLESLPQAPDLAVICLPPETLPQAVADVGRRGARAAVVISFDLAGDHGPPNDTLKCDLVKAARPHGLRLLGPRSLGILVPGIGLNASFAHRAARPGKLAFVAQSGSVINAVLDWSDARGIGFSALVSIGDMADLDLADLLDHLAADPQTRAILLYIESVGDARRFLSAARITARAKPVVAVKAGRYPEGARSVDSLGDSWAANDRVCQAAFERAGILRVFTLAELFDAVEILALGRGLKGDGLAILANGSGIGLLAADALIDGGGRLASLSESTLAALDQVLPLGWSHGNPIDLIGDAAGAGYREVINSIRTDPDVDAVLALHVPSALTSATESAEALASSEADGPLILASWVGDSGMGEPRRHLAKRGIPNFQTPEQAVRAFLYLVHYRRVQQCLSETPPPLPQGQPADTAAVAALIVAALSQGRNCLTEPEAEIVLAAYGIPVVKTRVAANPEEAATIASRLDGTFALRILSPDIDRKAEGGEVVFDRKDPGAVLQTARAMQDRIAKIHPGAAIQGFTVKPLVRHSLTQGLIIGVTEDPQFGPVILLGRDAGPLEAWANRALGLPPLNLPLARGLLERARAHRILEGMQGRAGMALDTIALVLIRVSQLIVEHPEIRGLEIGPLLLDDQGVMALDAHITLARPRLPGSGRLAIRPYPRELEEWISTPNGHRLQLRAIRPEDEPALRQAFAKLTPEEVRRRFFVPIPSLSHETAARLTQIDYDREMALILTEPGGTALDEIYGVVRLIADPGGERAEFAIIVRQAVARLGLGTLLMQRILTHARQRGIREVFGLVLQDNAAMLRLCDRLGFHCQPAPQEPGAVLVSLDLNSRPP